MVFRLLVAVAWPPRLTVLARIIICFEGLIHRLFFLPSRGLSGAADIPPFVSVRTRPVLIVPVVVFWQVWSAVLLPAFRNLWNDALSSAALRHAPLLGDKLLLQLVYICK